MRLAIFDLDHTLIAGDSDYLWGAFLVQQGAVDGPSYHRKNRAFYRQYQAGNLDPEAFLQFALQPLRDHPMARLLAWREDFMAQQIAPLVTKAAQALVDKHRQQGDILLMATATNAFITAPIAKLFGIGHLVATEPEQRAGRFTGQITGEACYSAGKLRRVQSWLHAQGFANEESWAYSDSMNDRPLLEWADHPAVVNPDPLLRRLADARGWPVLKLR